MSSKKTKVDESMLRAIGKGKGKDDWPMCRAAGIDPSAPLVLLTSSGIKARNVIVRKGENDKKFISIKMIKTKPRPDGTEKSGFGTTLYAGTTYSIPISIAKILLKEGSAERADKPKNKRRHKK